MTPDLRQTVDQEARRHELWPTEPQWAYFSVGYRHQLDDGNDQMAEIAYRLALDVRPDFADAHYYLSEILWDKGSYLDCWRHGIQSILLGCENITVTKDPFYGAAVCWTRMGGDVHRTVILLELSIMANPGWNGNYLYLADVELKRNKPDRAVELLRMMLDQTLYCLDPTFRERVENVIRGIRSGQCMEVPEINMSTDCSRSVRSQINDHEMMLWKKSCSRAVAEARKLKIGEWIL